MRAVLQRYIRFMCELNLIDSAYDVSFFSQRRIDNTIWYIFYKLDVEFIKDLFVKFIKRARIVM